MFDDDGRLAGSRAAYDMCGEGDALGTGAELGPGTS
jgi:hypothetical protein